jgi:hypothetical protein
MTIITIDTDQLQQQVGAALIASAKGVDALAAVCLSLHLDPTLWPLSATVSGRVLSSMGRLAAGGYESKQLTTSTEASVKAVGVVYESHLPADLEAAVTGAGVEADVLASLYWDETHGQAFRQRIKSKWMTFTQLVSRGLIQNPTGFFVSAVRKNWHLSSSYEPGKVAAPKIVAAIPPANACPLSEGATVRHAGGADLFRVARVWLKAGVWWANIWEVGGAYDSDRPCAELRLA